MDGSISISTSSTEHFLPFLNDFVLAHFYVLFNPFVFLTILYKVSEHVPAFETFLIGGCFTEKCLIAKIWDDLQCLDLVFDVLKLHSLYNIRLYLYVFVARITNGDFPCTFRAPDLCKITVLESLSLDSKLFTIIILTLLQGEVPLSCESLPDGQSVQLV